MKKLNESVMLRGDVVLTTTTHPISKGIRAVTKSDVSHAMIYVEPYSVIDSTGDGVHSRNTQRLFYDDSCQIHVLRYVAELTKTELQKITDYARNNIGTEYSKTEAAKTILGGGKASTKKLFCSRLVARAYAYAGISIVSDKDYCTPEDILNSEKLILVDGSARYASTEEASSWQRIPSTPEMMQSSTNFILNGARKIERSIQSLSDIDHFLIRNPSHDLEIASLYEESGYLTLWQLEKQKNPWQYDVEILEIKSGEDDSPRMYCEMVVGKPEEDRRRYETNLRGYQYYLSHMNLKTFRLLYELYSILVRIHDQRVKVAQDWLKMHKQEAGK